MTENRKNQTTGHKRAVRPGTTRTGRVMLFILLGLVVCTAVFLISIYPMVGTRAGRDANIKIPTGATEQNVHDSVAKYLGDDYADHVMRLARMRHPDFSRRTGAYTITSNMSPFEAMRKLTSGAQTPVRITVNGFRSLPLLVNRISAKLQFPADSLWAVLNDSDFMAGYGLNRENAMALFVDDTYEVYWNTSARDVVKKIGDNYSYFWGKTRTNKAGALGLTPAEVMVLASIVDEETNARMEKGTIAQLYINRLNNNMRLQADPTVRFAVGDFTIQRINRDHLKTESPYNTYLHHGLPPGPIRTTSKETVNYILNSEPNNYLYMCAKEDFSGTHNFSADYDEHIRNASRYQSALDAKGIKH